MRLLSILLLSIFANLLIAQDSKMEIPYEQIPDYPENFSEANILARMIDGLGYRLYWATEDLRPEDISYKPAGENTKTVDETMDHIIGLCKTVNNLVFQQPNVRSTDVELLSFEEKRQRALTSLMDASLRLKKGDLNVADLELIYMRGEEKNTFPVWNLINGQLSDAIYHTGQLVSYRRSSGNPMSPLVNVFRGKNREPKKEE